MLAVSDDGRGMDQDTIEQVFELFFSPPGTPESSGETVLLVEDKRQILEMGQAILEELRYKAIPAGTPGEVLHQTESQAREMMLLITDVVMPEMNGRALEQLARERMPEIQALFNSRPHPV